MIRYALKCEKDHGFESWFQSSAALEDLRAAGHLSCPVCGSTRVEKALMAPVVARSGPPTDDPPRPDLSAPANPMEEMLAAMRRQVEENS